MQRKGMRPGFIKPVDFPGQLKKGLIRKEDLLGYYRVAQVEKIDGKEYYFPDEPLAKIEEVNGEERVLQPAFRKGKLVDEVPLEEVYRAECNTARMEMEAYQRENLRLREEGNFERKEMPIAVRQSPVLVMTTQEAEEAMVYRDERTGKTEKISNFRVYPIALIETISGEQLLKREFRLEIIFHGEEHILTIHADKLEMLENKICSEVLGTVVYCSIYKAGAKLAELVKKQLLGLPTEICQIRPGWMDWNGRRIFAHDARKAEEGLKIMTGKRIISTPEFEENLVLVLTKVLSMGALNIMAPMVAVALLGPLYELFRLINVAYTPQFALFVNGKSGSFKTSVSKVIFNFYNADNPIVPASFKDTVTSLEKRLEEYACAPVLIDDFYATGLAKERALMQKSLETIIRYVGDGIGKNRSNAALQDVKGVRPTGMVIITGEDTAGQLSTLLRCLILNVDKETFDQNVLTKLQNTPTMWSSFLAQFCAYLELHYEEVVSMIWDLYPKIREKYLEQFEERRPAEQLVQMLVTFEILRTFLKSRSVESERYIDQIIDECGLGCYQAVKESQDYADRNSGEKRFANMLGDLIFSKKIVICESRKAYENNISESDGFSEGEFIFLNSGSAYLKIRKAFHERGKELGLSELEAKRVLEKEGLLITETERRGTEREKKYYEVKVSIGKNRRRMLKIPMERMKDFIDGVE